MSSNDTMIQMEVPIPSDVLIHVLEFALPLWGEDHDDDDGMTSIVGDQKSAHVLHVKQIQRSSEIIRQSLVWVASLRLVSRHWMSLLPLDPTTTTTTNGWYHVAKALGLDPPRYLYAGGNYWELCQSVWKAETQRAQAQGEAETRNATRPRIACGMRRPPNTHSPDHPHDPLKRPTMVHLPPELVERVAANAMALESFLKSVDFFLDNNTNNDQDGRWEWSQSALQRYRMFLHLKRSHPNVWLVPTVEIEFCWLSHIFRTETYWTDMAQLGIPLDHSLCLQHYGEVATFSKAVQGTAQLWNATFFESGVPYLAENTDLSWNIWNVVGGGLEPCRAHRSDPRRFFPQMGPPVPIIQTHATKNTPTNSKNGQNNNAINLPNIGLTAEEVHADLSWFSHLQEAFQEMNSNAYQVMRGNNGSSSLPLLLKQVLPSYERFLNLCHAHTANNDVLTNPAPPLVLDLVWHAHQMEPAQYKQDCLELFGTEFWHDPWPHGLGVMTEASDELLCAWKTTYGTPMADDWKYFNKH
jgi:hypothetical protein